MRASSVAWRGRGWKSHVPFTCSAQPPELHPLITRHRASGAPASPHAPSTHRSSAPRHPRVAVGALLGDQSVQDDLAHANNVAKVPPSHIRNFCIIAHIDHGKSTLADQLLLATHSVAQRDMQAQYLDGMDLERERGITIKLCAARMRYRGAADGQQYALNLIDTPGHVDFAYEVSRSLAACEGCLLVVDASQGVEAQTLANVYLALESDLTIIPVLNKIDLPGADVERVRQEITDVVGLDASDALLVSAKQGIGIAEVLEAVVQRIPPPRDTRGDPLRALIFDSYYDPYKGVVAQFRVMDGELRRGDVVRFMNTRCEHPVAELGVLAPKAVEVESLHAGEVGYLAAAIKSVADARVGDTVTLKREPATEALPGYTEVKPMVFCGMFTIDADQYGGLREALTKLQLSDAALSFEPEVSSAMGFGFRCGFLGLLHLEIVQERLEREYGLDLITTAPTVVFRARTSDGAEHVVDCPSKLPPAATLSAVLEPYVRLEVITPKEYVGPILDLLQTRRGEHIEMQFMTEARTTVVYDMPLAEVVMDLFDALKSRSRGYASMEYSITGWRENDLVLLEVSINGERVEPLAAIVHRATAYNIGRALVKKLKEVIPRQQFRVPIQASIGARVLASEAIPALRKDVLAKCYGGDISRKKKLLQKQAKGKKRMKSLGKVDVPQDAFMAVLRINRTGGED